jgi:hypothetical protein
MRVLFLILISNICLANEKWHIYSLNPNLKTEKLPLRTLKRSSGVRYLPHHIVVKHLNQYVKKDIIGFSQLQIEILYKDIIYKSYKRLKNKYPFISLEKRDELLLAFNNDSFYSPLERKPAKRNK